MKFAGTALRWILTAGLLTIALKQAEPSEWIPVFARVSWLWFAGAALCMAGIVLINSFKWKILLDAQGCHPGFLRILYHYAVGYFFNSFITGTGDIKRAASMGAEQNNIPKVTASVLAERWTGVLGQLGLAFCTISAFTLKNQSIWPIAIGAAIVVFGLAAVYFWFENYDREIPVHSKGIVALISRIRSAMSVYKGKRRIWWICMALSFAGPLLLVVIHILLAKSLSIPGSAWAMLILIPTVSVFAQLPITINGFGLQDYFMIVLFKHTLMPAEALALSIAFHALRLGVGATGGLIFAFLPNLGLKHDQK
ncbi:MAG: flippase-like domain-containing protein [bacterium]|nr:flippase-like domain-containing protein [bacterium]